MEGDKTKKCRRCKENKPYSSFYLVKQDGYEWYRKKCRDCENFLKRNKNNYKKICKKSSDKRSKKLEKDLAKKQKKDLKELKFKDSKNREEQWKDIPNFEGIYQASNKGNIRGLPFLSRTKTGKLSYRKSKNIKKTDNRGYLSASLTDLKGVTHKKGVHRWVLQAFEGESELQVDHKNGIKADNRLNNLRYCTNRENLNYIKELKPNNFKSKYPGVCKGRTGKWESSISINGREYYLGSYKNEKEASSKYNQALEYWNSSKKLPKKYINPDNTSKHKNIDYHSASKKWRVRTNGGVYIGIFETEKTALKVKTIVEYLASKNKDLSKSLIKKIRSKYS